jgi:hypothetical protein
MPEQELREQMRALAQGFIADLDKAASGELAEWRAEFMASLAELDAAAKRGTEGTQAALREAVTAYEKAAEEARKATRAAEDAARPAAVNLVLTGDYEGEAVVSVNDKELARTRLRTVPLDRLVPGIAKFEVSARKGTEAREGSLLFELKPGIQEVRIVVA